MHLAHEQYGDATVSPSSAGTLHNSYHIAGEALASCSGDKTVRIWTRSQPGSDEWVCSAILEEAQTRTIRCVSWSPDGRSLATASFDSTTAVWEQQVRRRTSCSACRARARNSMHSSAFQ